ncbi:MAG: hypothetical protein ACRDAO_07330 [Culicoidibacterales bacterium]
MSSEQKQSLLTKETKILLSCYIIEVILIFINFGLLLARKQASIPLVLALLAVSLFMYIYARKVKKKANVTEKK